MANKAPPSILPEDVPVTDDFVTNPDLTNSALKEGHAALLGATTVRPSAPHVETTATKPKHEKTPAAVRSTKKDPTTVKHASHKQEPAPVSPPKSPPKPSPTTNIKEKASEPKDYSATIELLESRITALMKEQTRYRKFQDNAEEYLDAQGQEITKMQAVITQQNVRIQALEAENDSFRTAFDSELKTLKKDLTNQVSDAVSIYRDTPDLIERLMQVTNQVMTHLPEDVKTTMKTVELTADEKKVVGVIKTRNAPPKRKLPKHAR